MQENSFKKDVLNDFLQMTMLFIASVIAVYKTSPAIRDLFFLIPLILAFRSKKDYFWFAYFFILINSPAFFFASRAQEAIFRLPFYSFVPTLSFTPMDLFLFITIFKALRKKRVVKFFLNKPLEFFLFYLFLVSIPVSFFLGTEIKPFINSLRSFFFFGIIFSYLRLIRNNEDILKFGYLMFPYLALILVDQLYLVNMGSYMISIFDKSMLGFYTKNSVTGEIRAEMKGVLIVFYALIFGYQINGLKKYTLFPGFSTLIFFMAFASFILSAARSWITIGIITLMGYLILSKNGLKLSIQLFIVGSSLVVFILSSNYIEMDYLDGILKRYSVMEDIASSGNLRQGTFADRIDNDIPKVMKGVAYSPILGVGMSKYMKIYYSNDVGFINTLLIYGIIGFPIFLIFLFRYIFHLNRLFRKDDFSQLEKNIFLSLILAFGGILAGYFFTWDFFSFFPEKVYFVSIVFATGDLVLELNRESNDQTTSNEETKVMPIT